MVREDGRPTAFARLGKRVEPREAALLQSGRVPLKGMAPRSAAQDLRGLMTLRTRDVYRFEAENNVEVADAAVTDR
jgi:hypothetical protein